MEFLTDRQPWNILFRSSSGRFLDFQLNGDHTFWKFTHVSVPFWFMRWILSKNRQKKERSKDELSSRYHLRYKSPISSGSFVHSSSIHCEMKMKINWIRILPGFCLFDITLSLRKTLIKSVYFSIRKNIKSSCSHFELPGYLLWFLLPSFTFWKLSVVPEIRYSSRSSHFLPL